ncbi:MAG: nucleotide pyrophosphohydrolase [Pseudomonadota bacterium]
MSSRSENPFESIRRRLREFAAARDWDQFHSPKNLAMALIVEAAELVEQFQWLSQAESQSLAPARRTAVEQELADIQIYLIRLADRLEIDLEHAVDAKLEINARKYPADQVRGSAEKYDARDDGG